MSRDHLHKQLLLVFLFFGLSAAGNCPAAALQGQVQDILSGDHITIKATDGIRREIKLIGLRIPDPDGRAGRIAKRHLAMLIAGRYISVEYTSLSPRGVILGTILHGGADIALRMISDGLALAVKHPRLQATRMKQYKQAEASARSRGLGFWQKLR